MSVEFEAGVTAGATTTPAKPTASANWDELASAALLGAQRGLRAGSLSPADVLDAAAVLAVARRAGARPLRLPGREAPAQAVPGRAESIPIDSDADAPLTPRLAAVTPAPAVHVRLTPIPSPGPSEPGSDPARPASGADADPGSATEPDLDDPAVSQLIRLRPIKLDPPLAHPAPAELATPTLTRPGPMPADPRPLVSEAAAVRLRSILDGYQKYLPEWLAAARAAGVRIPPVFFPELLDLTRNNALIRANVTVLLGDPGRWLAALNRSWAFFLTGPADPPAGTGTAAGPGTGPATRPAVPPVADFTAEARRLLGRAKNSNDLYNLVMRQPGLWPEEGSRLLIEYVAAHRYPAIANGLRIDGGLPTSRSSDWAIEQLQRTIGDHAPLHLRALVRELIEEPARPGAGAANPVVDLTEILDALTFRTDMHDELSGRRGAPPHLERRPH